MIDYKKEIIKSLKKVCNNSFQNTPKSWEEFPIITYTEENNSISSYVDNKEDICELLYKIDIWNYKGITDDLAKSVNTEMLELGFRRTFCSDVPNTDVNVKHKVMRFRKKVDLDGQR